jgi:hypothetical protein
LEHVEQDQMVFRMLDIVFSRSGKLIATMAEDPTTPWIGRPATIRVFEVTAGRETARIPFPEMAHAIRFADDDTAIEIAVGRRRIRWERYPLTAAEMLREACTFVQRNMNAPEWARFMGDEPERETCPGIVRP